MPIRRRAGQRTEAQDLVDELFPKGKVILKSLKEPPIPKPPPNGLAASGDGDDDHERLTGGTIRPLTYSIGFRSDFQHVADETVVAGSIFCSRLSPSPLNRP